MTSLKNLTDDKLYLHLADELSETYDNLNILRNVVNIGERGRIIDALNDTRASFDRAVALHAELVARGVVA